MEGTNTVMCINREDIPIALWRGVTYGRLVVSYRPEKKDPNITKLTVGVDIVHYPRYFRTPTVSILKNKLILNSVKSTLVARYMTFDINDFYVNVPMKQNEYMRMKLRDLLKDFIK